MLVLSILKHPVGQNERLIHALYKKVFIIRVPLFYTSMVRDSYPKWGMPDIPENFEEQGQENSSPTCNKHPLGDIHWYRLFLRKEFFLFFQQ